MVSGIFLASKRVLARVHGRLQFAKLLEKLFHGKGNEEIS